MSNNIDKKYTFVSINIDFTTRYSLRLDMVGYLQDTLDAFAEELGSTPTSPVSKLLFDVNPYTNPLSEINRKVFHSVFARLDWKVNKARYPACGRFLGTRTLKADADDWKKLKRLLAYVKGTLND